MNAQRDVLSIMVSFMLVVRLRKVYFTETDITKTSVQSIVESCCPILKPQGARCDSRSGTRNLEEEGSYFEGDMILPVGKIGKVTINNLAQRWTNGIVPYVIEGGFSKQIAV